MLHYKKLTLSGITFDKKKKVILDESRYLEIQFFEKVDF